MKTMFLYPWKAAKVDFRNTITTQKLYQFFIYMMIYIDTNKLKYLQSPSTFMLHVTSAREYLFPSYLFIDHSPVSRIQLKETINNWKAIILQL